MNILGFDGEGTTLPDGSHKYTLLLCSDKSGNHWDRVSNPDGLTSSQCLTFLCDFAERSSKDTVGFSYSFLYDITKILENLPNHLIYRLLRPHLRYDKRRKDSSPHPIYWAADGNAFSINYFNGKFTVGRVNKKKLVIWDVIKFFQGAFIDSIEKWKVGTEYQQKMIRGMKMKRSDFTDEMKNDVEIYCKMECMCLAELVEKLLNAHENTGLKLKQFYGAGSTGSALLDKFNTKSLISKEIPYATEEMADGVTRAFFGGRFENSIVGIIRENVYSYDISSAYPYQITFLPCLEHGKWKTITRREELDKYCYALVKWSGPEIITQLYWGGLPFRRSDGSIIFPSSGGIGFTYIQEFLQAEKLFGHRFVRAWVLEQECDCQPFKDVPLYYLERIKLGKDGAGIVLKLALNSMYGKMAQSLGDSPPYRSWIWAGMVTSGCRAQIIEMMSKHNDISNLLAIATDGIYSLERLDCPKPKFTGTDKTGKPLGGWEEKVITGGIFFARSGINFRLESNDVDLIRSRGISRKVVVSNRQMIIDAYERGDSEVYFPDVSRFWGARSSVYTLKDRPPTSRRSDRYGKWVATEYKLSFNPQPKRASRIDNKLTTWQIEQDEVSAVYTKARLEDMDYDPADDEQSW